jgi:hypothetical protein
VRSQKPLKINMGYQPASGRKCTSRTDRVSGGSQRAKIFKHASAMDMSVQRLTHL